MAPHSSTLAWKIPRAEEPGRLQSMGSLEVGHNWTTSLSLFTSCIGEGNGNPLQCSCLENPREEGAWWAAVYGVAQSRTRLKRLSSSSRYDVNCDTNSLHYPTDLVVALRDGEGCPVASEVKVSARNAGDLGSIPGSGRFSGEGNGNPLQYSCLENPMDGGAWWATVNGVQRVGQDWATSLSL